MRDATGTEWRVGDLCTYIHNELGAGVVYRVKAFKELKHRWKPNEPRIIMKIQPIFGFLQDITGRAVRDIEISSTAHGAKRMTIVDLGHQHMQLAQLISYLSKQLSGETEETPADVQDG